MIKKTCIPVQGSEKTGRLLHHRLAPCTQAEPRGRESTLATESHRALAYIGKVLCCRLWRLVYANKYQIDGAHHWQTVSVRGSMLMKWDQNSRSWKLNPSLRKKKRSLRRQLRTGNTHAGGLSSDSGCPCAPSMPWVAQWARRRYLQSSSPRVRGPCMCRACATIHDHRHPANKSRIDKLPGCND
jgi:hypothetical protein